MVLGGNHLQENAATEAQWLPVPAALEIAEKHFGIQSLCEKIVNGKEKIFVTDGVKSVYLKAPDGSGSLATNLGRYSYLKKQVQCLQKCAETQQECGEYAASIAQDVGKADLDRVAADLNNPTDKPTNLNAPYIVGLKKLHVSIKKANKGLPKLLKTKCNIQTGLLSKLLGTPKTKVPVSQETQTTCDRLQSKMKGILDILDLYEKNEWLVIPHIYAGKTGTAKHVQGQRWMFRVLFDSISEKFQAVQKEIQEFTA